MLRIIEYSLLAVSLLVVIGLIVSGSRKNTDSGHIKPPTLDDDSSGAHERGKTA